MLRLQAPHYLWVLPLFLAGLFQGTPHYPQLLSHVLDQAGGPRPWGLSSRMGGPRASFFGMDAEKNLALLNLASGQECSSFGVSLSFVLFLQFLSVSPPFLFIACLCFWQAASPRQPEAGRRSAYAAENKARRVTDVQARAGGTERGRQGGTAQRDSGPRHSLGGLLMEGSVRGAGE